MEHLTDKFYLKTLTKVLERLEKLNREINYEGYVQRAELNARIQLGLREEEGIKHYNKWMKQFGLNHLIVKL